MQAEHIFGGGGVNTFNSYMTDFFHMGGKFGVNIFLLIGCWFMVDSVDLEHNSKRIKKIVKETAFYGVVLAVIDLLFFNDIHGIKDFILSFKYWYTFGYIAMLIIIVFIDRLKKLIPIYLILFSILFIVVTAYGTIVPYNPIIKIFDKAIFIGPVFFTYVFLLVKSFKAPCIKMIKQLNPIIFINAFVILYILMYVTFLWTQSYWIRGMFSPLCLGAAICLFLFFASMDLGYNKFINKLAAGTYATYLIQTNTNLNMMERLKDIFTETANTHYYFALCTLHVVSIFIIALLLNSIYKVITVCWSNIVYKS